MGDTDLDKEQVVEIDDFSGGVQEKSTEYQVKPNELTKAYNSRYETIGGVKKAEGYSQQGSNLTSTTTTSTSTSTTSSSTSTSSSSSTSTSTSTT